MLNLCFVWTNLKNAPAIGFVAALFECAVPSGFVEASFSRSASSVFISFFSSKNLILSIHPFYHCFFFYKTRPAHKIALLLFNRLHRAFNRLSFSFEGIKKVSKLFILVFCVTICDIYQRIKRIYLVLDRKSTRLNSSHR